VIRTARLTLRPPSPADLDPLHRVFADARAMRFWSHEAHEDLARTQQTLDGMMESHAKTGLELVIERDGIVIGKAGLWRLAELGYILHPDHWGKGLAQEALEAILEAAWALHPELTEITAEIDPRNESSARLLTRLGFAETHRAERTIKVWGEWCDSAYYALRRGVFDHA
jgi:RimJ/RimL family protein N-acetyltransferase